jgi:hypothetical protein
MTLVSLLVAQFDLGETALWVVRVAAGIAGAFLGWFVSDPVARITYRLAFQQPIPPWSLPWVKLAGAAVVGLLVYFLIPLGGGPGGWGFGPGLGGGPGLGPGKGSPGKDTGVAAKDAGKKNDGDKPPEKHETPETDNKKPADKVPPAGTRRTVEIEVLGGKRYPGGERYYRVLPDGNPITLKEVEGYFKEHAGPLELRVVLTEDSPDYDIGPIEDLTRLADRYQIPYLRKLQKVRGP